jgi:hypothetical protein
MCSYIGVLVAILMHGGRLVAGDRAAAGGEGDEVAAAGDLAGHGGRVVAGRVHEDEARLRHLLGIFVDGVERHRAALGDGAERLFQNGGEAAGLVAEARGCC